MDWKLIYDRLKSVSSSDDEVNRQLFAAVEGWSYPLIGAAYNVFENRSREGSSVDYTGNAEAALAFAREMYPLGKFNIEVDERDRVVVNMSGSVELAGGVSRAISSQGKASTIAIGVLVATLIVKLSN